jgi:hypothetical protein
MVPKKGACLTALILFSLMIVVGCSPAYFQPTQPGNDYRWLIENWQHRIQKEGWNEALVDDVTRSCIELSKYEPDPKDDDHWETYQEFTRDFKGDCEDITSFMYGTLKRLNYPNNLRFRILRMPLGDHAVLMVELPDQRWKMFNSVPQPGAAIDIALARTVVEWDDQYIYYP